jgi:hypothetical protein
MSTNTIDKFGRRNPRTKVIYIRAQSGRGLKLTRDGQYDIQTKILRNVGEPTERNDAATREYVDDALTRFQIAFADFGNLEIARSKQDISTLKDTIAILLKHIIDLEKKQELLRLSHKTIEGTPVSDNSLKQRPLSIMDELHEKGIMI